MAKIRKMAVQIGGLTMKRNTHTTKKYAISLIEEIKQNAIDALNLSELDLNEFKCKAFENNKVDILPKEDIKKLFKSKLKRVRDAQYGYSSTYYPSVSLVDLIQIPESYKVAIKEFKKNKPRKERLLKKIEEAYDEAESTIMLGGTDTAMGQAVDKLKKLVSQIQ